MSLPGLAATPAADLMLHAFGRPGQILIVAIVALTSITSMNAILAVLAAGVVLLVLLRARGGVDT